MCCCFFGQGTSWLGTSPLDRAHHSISVNKLIYLSVVVYRIPGGGAESGLGTSPSPVTRDLLSMIAAVGDGQGGQLPAMPNLGQVSRLNNDDNTNSDSLLTRSQGTQNFNHVFDILSLIGLQV